MSSGLSFGAETLAGSDGWIFALGRKHVGAGNDLDRCPVRWRCVSRVMAGLRTGGCGLAGWWWLSLPFSLTIGRVNVVISPT